MRIFEPHAHMVSRVTDDYERMALSGVKVVVEPAFWVGQPRQHVEVFVHYFDTLLGWERYRARQFGIRHHCTLALNPREANEDRVNEEVLAILPRYLQKDGVLAVGEVGFDDITPREERCFAAQIELARAAGLPLLVHSPHRDKRRGLERTVALLREAAFPMERVLLDHNTEETVRLSHESGAYVGFSIYPHTKMDEGRMVEILRRFGVNRMIINSACDWGISDPLKVPRTALALRQAGFDDDRIDQLVWGNPVAFFAQSGRLDEAELALPVDPPGVEYEGSSIQRGPRA